MPTTDNDEEYMNQHEGILQVDSRRKGQRSVKKKLWEREQKY